MNKSHKILLESEEMTAVALNTLATKDDIKRLEMDIRQLSLETKLEYAKLDARIDKLDTKVDGLAVYLLIRLGGLIGIATFILGILIRLK